MITKTAWAALALVAVSGIAWAQHDANGHAAHMAHDGKAKHAGAGQLGAHGGAKDTRELVAYPQPMIDHTLASMREHLVTLQRIQSALGQGDFDGAAEVAETGLGMSALHDHGASEVAKYMPAAMATIGTTMHRSASQFALVARDASVNGDLKPVLTALSKVTAQCVACHASYRLH
jgi:hypothetical protein